VSTEYRRVMDRWTDRWTDRHLVTAQSHYAYALFCKNWVCKPKIPWSAHITQARSINSVIQLLIVWQLYHCCLCRIVDWCRRKAHSDGFSVIVYVVTNYNSIYYKQLSQPIAKDEGRSSRTTFPVSPCTKRSLVRWLFECYHLEYCPCRK